MKRCTKCGAEKDQSLFYVSKGKPDGLHSWCKACEAKSKKAWYAANRDIIAAKQREYKTANIDMARDRLRGYQLRYKYGLSAEQFQEMFSRHDGRCAICRRRAEEVGSGKNALCVDHCHRSGSVRGLLCTNCNRGIGYLGDDQDRLAAAIAYLLSYENPPITEERQPIEPQYDGKKKEQQNE